MRLLISAYACSPHHGSEWGVGWNWTTEARRAGHEVWALASSVHRSAILEACHPDPELREIRWTFPELSFWPLQAGEEPRRERTYNLLWQIEALRLARRLHLEVAFDAVHHLTWGGVRAPTFLGALGALLIVGPIGGGESAPRRLRPAFGLRGRVAEALRDASNLTAKFNPLLRKGLSDASVIFAKTADTRAILSEKMQGKCFVMTELAAPPTAVLQPRPTRSESLRLLFVSRLIYWKGAHIAVEAFAHVLHRRPDARLTLVGKGPEQGRIARMIEARGLKDAVRLVPWLPRAKLDALYRSHDLLVFPSLHDSSGNVVVEALASGLPVLCLDLGGPKEIVTPACGIVVRTGRLNTTEVARRMADEIVDVFDEPQRLAALSGGAVARAREFALPPRLRALYDAVARQAPFTPTP